MISAQSVLLSYQQVTLRKPQCVKVVKIESGTIYNLFTIYLLTNRSRCDIIITERGKENPAQKTHDRKVIMFYWFTFADGYRVCTRGFDRIEKMHAELAHGKIISKVKA